MNPSDTTDWSRPGWATSWIRFWFPTTRAVPLAICRITLVAAWLLLFAKPWDQLAVALTYDPGPYRSGVDPRHPVGHAR